MHAMRGFTGGGEYPFRGKKIKVLHTDQKRSEGNIALVNQKVGKQKAFTLAEVLITLGIIGIVAAMTMPMLIGKYKKQVTVTQLKKVYTVLSQMVLQAQEDNGPVYFSTSEQVDPNVAENFFKLYWLPYFNSPTVAKEGTVPYGVGLPYLYRNGTQFGINIQTEYSSGRLFFTTNDGTSYFVYIMDWDIEYDEDGNQISQTARYATKQQVWVDLNGIKPPNIFGKDVFRFNVFFDNNIVRPHGYDKTTDQINEDCSHTGTGNSCAAKIMNDGWEIKDDYPW